MKPVAPACRGGHWWFATLVAICAAAGVGAYAVETVKIVYNAKFCYPAAARTGVSTAKALYVKGNLKQLRIGAKLHGSTGSDASL